MSLTEELQRPSFIVDSILNKKKKKQRNEKYLEMTNQASLPIYFGKEIFHRKNGFF